MWVRGGGFGGKTNPAIPAAINRSLLDSGKTICKAAYILANIYQNSWLHNAGTVNFVITAGAIAFVCVNSVPKG